MGLFKKEKKIELPENGHWVLVCKDCKQRFPIPSHTEMPGMVFDFDPKRAKISVAYHYPDGSTFTISVDGMKNFFDVEAEPAGNLVLSADVSNNLKVLHKHIASHYQKFYVGYLQTDSFWGLTYSKMFMPGGFTYENNKLEQLDMIQKLAAYPKPGMLNPNKAEIPGYSWPLE